MSREHKAGLVVTCSFLCLVGAVIGLKLREPAPGDTAVADASKPPDINIPNKNSEPRGDRPDFRSPAVRSDKPDGKGKKPPETPAGVKPPGERPVAPALTPVGDLGPPSWTGDLPPFNADGHKPGKDNEKKDKKNSAGPGGLPPELPPFEGPRKNDRDGKDTKPAPGVPEVPFPSPAFLDSPRKDDKKGPPSPTVPLDDKKSSGNGKDGDCPPAPGIGTMTPLDPFPPPPAPRDKAPAERGGSPLPAPVGGGPVGLGGPPPEAKSPTGTVPTPDKEKAGGPIAPFPPLPGGDLKAPDRVLTPPGTGTPRPTPAAIPDKAVGPPAGPSPIGGDLPPPGSLGVQPPPRPSDRGLPGRDGGFQAAPPEGPPAAVKSPSDPAPAPPESTSGGPRSLYIRDPYARPAAGADSAPPAAPIAPVPSPAPPPAASPTPPAGSPPGLIPAGLGGADTGTGRAPAPLAIKEVGTTPARIEPVPEPGPAPAAPLPISSVPPPAGRIEPRPIAASSDPTARSAVPTPPARRPGTVTMHEAVEYSWRAGDDWRALALKHYGSEAYGPALQQYNRADGRLDESGTPRAGSPVIYLPTKQHLEENYAYGIDRGAAAPR